MFEIIEINCPEKTIIMNNMTKTLKKISSQEDFIVTFIIQYDIENINLIKDCLKKFNKDFQKKYKFIEFYLINDSTSKECDGSERIALVLSNICSFKNSVRLVSDKKELMNLYDIYQTTLTSKIRKKKW